MAVIAPFDSATFFRLKTIEVSSAKHLTREEILALAGVEPGKDLLAHEPEAHGRADSARTPGWRRCALTAISRTRLSIAITEREPLAMVNMGFIYYLDKKGTVFKVLNQGDKLDYPGRHRLQ